MPSQKMLVRNYLTKYHKSPNQPFSLLVINKNLNDGLGDFLHNYDVYKYLRKRFEGDDSVVVSGLCFITKNKLELINRIYQEDFLAHGVVQITSAVKQNISPGSFVLCDEEYSDELNYAADANAVINVSVLLQRSDEANLRPFSNIVIDYLENKMDKKNKPSIFSVLEYGAMNEGFIATVRGEEIIEYAMGIRSYQAGIKFIPALLEITPDTAAIQIKEQNNTVLQRFLLDDHDKTFVGFGYLQSPDHTLKFVLSAAHIARKENITLYINHQFFKNKNIDQPSNQMLKELLQHLKQKTVITQVEFISHTGECLDCISLGIDTKSRTPKVLRLINFPGTTEADKMLILALSDMVGASGDTSISEMISSRKLPFFAVPAHHKLDFVYQIIGDLRHKFPAFKECIQYIEQGLPGGVDDYFQYLDFARDHAELIGEQWAKYCQYLAEHCNIEKSIDHLFEEAVIHKMGIMGNEEEKTAIIPLQQAISAKKMRDGKLFSIIRCDEDIKLSDEKKKEIFQKKIADWKLDDSAFPTVELVMGSLPKLWNQRRSLKELADTPFFVSKVDELVPLLLQAVDSYSIKKLTDYYLSWLPSLLPHDEEFVRAILDKLYNIVCSSKSSSGLGLFPVSREAGSYSDLVLLCKVTLLAFLALRVEQLDLLFKSKEWPLARPLADKNPLFSEVISAIELHDKFRNVSGSLKR